MCFSDSVSKLEPTQEAEQFLSDDHPLQRSVTIINDEFETAQDDPGLDIFFVWGLDDVNRDGVRLLFKPDFFGEPTFVDEFEFNEKCQTALLSSCSDVRLNPDYSAHIQQEAGRGSVSCFIEEFAAYSVLGTLRNCQDVALGAWRNQNWQVDPADISEMMDDFLAQRSCLSEEGESIATRYKNTLGWDGSKVRFAGFSLESSVVDPFSTLPEGTVRTEYDKMLEIAEALDTTVKEACGSDVVMTDLEAKFVFMVSVGVRSPPAGRLTFPSRTTSAFMQERPFSQVYWELGSLSLFYSSQLGCSISHCSPRLASLLFW